jgi:hypothetical protein
MILIIAYGIAASSLMHAGADADCITRLYGSSASLFDPPSHNIANAATSRQAPEKERGRAFSTGNATSIYASALLRSQVLAIPRS